MDSMAFLLAAAVAAIGTAACSQSDTASPGPTGGAVEGSVDMHCIDDAGQPIDNPTSQAACALPEGGLPDGGVVNDYGPTLFNQEGDDDDCKYHVKWTSTPVYRNKSVTFTVEATRRVDQQPLTGAYPYAEVYLDDTHPAPNTKQQQKELAPGRYSVGPIVFDEPGNWTVRFHFYQDCADVNEASPHGHAAFYVGVP